MLSMRLSSLNPTGPVILDTTMEVFASTKDLRFHFGLLVAECPCAAR